MIEDNYRIDFYYDGVNTGYVTGHYSQSEINRFGVEALTVDEYSIGDIDEFSVTSDTEIHNMGGGEPSLVEWLVAIASAKTDIVFKATKINLHGNYVENFVKHVDNKITVRLSADEIIYKMISKEEESVNQVYVDSNIVFILDCEKFISENVIFGDGCIILTDRLQHIECYLGMAVNLGIYSLSNLKYIGNYAFNGAHLFIVDKDTLPNETVYSFEPTIVEGEYEGIPVLKTWNLIKFADDCVIETGGFSGGIKDHIMFDLCNISNRSGKGAFLGFENLNGYALVKIKNTLRTDFFDTNFHIMYAYCEDEEFLRNISHYDTPASDWLMRPDKFVVQAVRPNNTYDNLIYNLKYTPNINTNTDMTLCCDVNCLEYGVGHYTAEMTDDLNIDHKTLCVGYEKTNKYYRIKEEEQ
jgi:hypothetical protein